MSASRLASALRRAPFRSPASLQRLLPAMATSSIPQAPWVSAVQSTQHKTRRMPQVIAHRGYKARWPENTIEAMRAAVEAGAHGIETDVHLSSDGVVVLSHDPTLKRCYGREDKISDVSWAELSTLKTVMAPHLSMPRLQDVLAWLSEPGNKDTWLLLDIKLDDDADALLKAIADAFNNVPSSWNQRVVLGCWNATFLKAARRHLPTFPIVHISFSLGYTRHFLPQPNMGANMLMRRLVGPRGPSFMRAVNGPLLVWTVNAPESMEWCLANNLREDGHGLIDGVITDDPALYIAVRKRWEDQQDGIVALPPQPSFTELIRSSLRGAASYVWIESMCKLFFLVRRFWNGKFDYLAKGEVL